MRKLNEYEIIKSLIYDYVCEINDLKKKLENKETEAEKDFAEQLRKH